MWYIFVVFSVHGCEKFDTVKLLKIQTPNKIAVITLKFEESDFTVE